MHLILSNIFKNIIVDWSHHHLNAFCLSIENLKKELHDESAHLTFIPAVEQEFCENEIPSKPWIGIIHNAQQSPDDFYVPDLNRLCSRKYRPWFKHCKGLFTLTNVQEEYLNKNLKSDHIIPIQTIYYPIAEPKNFEEKPLTFLQDWGNRKVDLVLVGSYQRDFNFFYRAKVPENIEKALLIGDEVIEREASENCPEEIKLIPRASSEEYEKLLENSILFLSLKTDGLANTLVLEAIARNLPLVAPRFKSICQYLGEDYPLLYDPNEPDLTGLIQIDKLVSAVEYLKKMDKSHLSQKSFCKSIQESFVLRSIPPVSDKYDLTISICSFKRTHHLPMILDSLWNRQTFEGKIQIIVWNNNVERKLTVEKICKNFVQSRLANSKRFLFRFQKFFKYKLVQTMINFIRLVMLK